MFRLVVVDDQEALREGLVALLRERGVEVAGTAPSGIAALDTVRVAEPDVVLLDLGVSDMPAPDITRELLAESPDLAIMLYGDDSGARFAHEAMAAGASGLALKRGSSAELVDALEQLAESGSYIDPRLDRTMLATGGRPHAISAREREVLGLMAQGLTADAVAEHLGVSVETVRTHTRNAVRKLDARNRVHAICLALLRGEIDVDGI